MKETSEAFGQGGCYAGILCTPERSRGAAVLMLNAGLLHKVGPFRMWVDLSRRLAKSGIASLRFDLGGLGDSSSWRGGTYEERALHDIGAALTFLTERGHDRLFVLGLCSGAINAHLIAVADERVRGLIALDGFNWPTLQFHARHYGPRALDPRRWVRFARRKLVADDGAEEGPAPMFDEEFPPRTQVAEEFRGLVGRGVHMLYVYTGGVESYCNYRRQLEDNFRDVDFQGFLDVERFGSAEHTYADMADRERLFTLVERWLLARAQSR